MGGSIWPSLFGERLGKKSVLGLLIGFVGLVFLSLASGGEGLDPVGVVAVLIGAMAWAFGSLYSHRAAMPANTYLATALQMVAAGVALIGLSALTGEFARFELAQVTGRSLTALAYLIVFGSIIGFGTFVWLNRAASSAVANTFNYVSPVIALGLGVVLLDEPITGGKILAGAIALAGVTLIISDGKGREAEADRGDSAATRCCTYLSLFSKPAHDPLCREAAAG